MLDLANSSDEELLQHYVKGAVTAFECLYERHKGASYRFLFRQVAEKNHAEDLMQELWCKVVKNARYFNEQSKFTTWLYQIARNLLADTHRHLQVVAKHAQLSEAAEIHSSAADTALILERSKAALSKCLKSLPRVQLESFLLKEEASLTQKEIADVMQATLEATKSRLRVAYGNLKRCVGLQLGEPNER